MKPIKIHHGNKQPDGIDVFVELELSEEDKKNIHDLHIKSGYENYDINDISMFVWIYVNNDGNVVGYSFDEASYYPAQQGEVYYENTLLPAELEQKCVDFVKGKTYQIM